MRKLSILIGLSCWFLGASPLWANTLDRIRISNESTQTRVILDLGEKPSFSYFTLTETKPVRLVLDLKNTELAMKLPQKVLDSNILTNIRKSRPVRKGDFRLVFELKKEADFEFSTLSPSGDNGYRLVVDLPYGKTQIVQKEPATKPTFQAIEEIEKNLSAITETAMPFGNDDIIIAIDPGHGGRDPGAIGPKRKYEKHITLAIAKDIAKLINSVQGMEAVLTRTGDYSVDLNKRSDIARRYRAHFLVSIHADGFHQPEPSGASVWVLSKNRANSEIGRWIERHEKQSELLGGGSVLQQYQDQNLSKAVLDLQFNNSQKEGYNVAIEVLEELGKVTNLHKPNPEFASLAVLRAPDIPSILVEAGFITNPKEEKLLLSRSYQEKIAKAVFRGIKGYFERVPPDGTLFAAIKNGVRHKVKSGESLSVIAEKYGITVEDIMKKNNLTSEVLQTSQELIIYNAEKQAYSSSKTNGSAEYTVQYGDYLGKIAGNYGVSIEEIRDMNLLNSDKLQIGQVLIIPGS